MGIGSKFGITAETGNNIQTLGLVFYVDAAYKKSYPGSGTTWTTLKGSNNVTLLNGPTFSADNNGCIVFDGNDDNAQIEGNPGVTQNIFNATANSVCAWVYNTDLSQDATVVGLWSTQYLLYMDTDGSGDGYRVLYVTGGGNKSTSANNINAIQDQWQYVVSTFSGTAVSLYVDGALIETVTFSSTTMTTSTSNIAIGADAPNGIRDFKGRISNVSFYDRALTAADVLQNYNAGKDRFGL
jgi:hypothetical protein